MSTLAQVRTRIRQRSNNEHTNGQFVTDAELTGLINVSYKDLYGTLVDFSLHRAETTYTVTADGSSSYALPVGLYAVLNVYRVDNGCRTRLPRHSDRQRPDANNSGPAASYRMRGSSIVFDTVPSSGTYEIDYIPSPGDLSADADTLDAVLAWDEYVVVDVAIKVLQKEGSLEEAAMLMQERERILRRIENQANAAEFTESRVVEDVRDYRQRDEGDFPRRGYRGPLW